MGRLPIIQRLASRPSLFGVDDRVVYWACAVTAWVGGFLLLGWGPHWFFDVYGMRAIDLPGVPFGMAAIIRIFGAFIMADGCFAAAVARTADPFTRHSTRFWFLIANAVVVVMFTLQQHEILGGGLPEDAAKILLVVIVLGVLFGSDEGPAYGRMTTLFGETPTVVSTQQLRSRYEEQIREAAQQEERNRLARELHDSIKQQVFAIQTSAATAQVRFDSDTAGARQALEQVRASARDAMTEMEVMLDQLRASPLENTGLVEALKKQCEALGLRTGAQVSFDVRDIPAAERIQPGTLQAVFRVAQEAMSNIARHARARNVRVILGVTGNLLQLVVEDDGAGFDQDNTRRGMGLTNMRERAEHVGGQLDVKSHPGGGTKLALAVPCLSSDLGLTDFRREFWLYFGLLDFQIAIGFWQRDILWLAFIPAAMLLRAFVRLRARERELRTRHGVRS